MIQAFVTTYHPDRGDRFGALRRLGMAASTIGWWLGQQAQQRVRLTVIGVREARGHDYQEDLLRWLQRTGHAAPDTWTAALDWTRFRYVEIPALGSQRERHVTALRLAGDAELAILADDDLVPWDSPVPWSLPDTPERWDAHVQRVFAERPGLAMCSAFPMPSTLRDPLTAPGVERDRDVWYVSSVGGVRVVRPSLYRGELPPLEARRGPGYDSTLCEWLRGGPGQGKDGPTVGYFRRWIGNHSGSHASIVWPGPMALYREGAAC